MTAPFKFEFKVPGGTQLFLAEFNLDKNHYAVSWEDDEGHPYTITYENHTPQAYINEGVWEVTKVIIEHFPKYNVGDVVTIVKYGSGFGADEVGKTATITQVGLGVYRGVGFAYRIKEALGNNVPTLMYGGWHAEASFSDRNQFTKSELKNFMRVELSENGKTTKFIVNLEKGLIFNDTRAFILSAFDEDLVNTTDNMIRIVGVYECASSYVFFGNAEMVGDLIWKARKTDKQIKIEGLRKQIIEIENEIEELMEE